MLNRFLIAFLSLALTSTASLAASQELLARSNGWKILNVGSKTPTKFSLDQGVLNITANKSVAFLYKEIMPVHTRQPKMQWQWRVDSNIPATDLSKKGKDDRPVAVHLWFEDKKTSLSGAFGSLLGKPRVGHLITYVWGGKQAAGTMLRNPYFPEKGIIIVLRNGGEKTGKWLSETRDIVADYSAAFGHAPKLSELSHVSVSADTEDTRTSSRSSVRQLKIID